MCVHYEQIVSDIQNENKESSVHVNEIKCHSGEILRYGCNMSSAAVARSSGLLEYKSVYVKSHEMETYIAKHLILKSSACSESFTSSGTGGGSFD